MEMICNPEAEAALLCVCINDESQEFVARTLGAGIYPESFFYVNNQQLFKLISEQFNQGELTGMIELADKGADVKHLMKITSTVDSKSGFESYVNIVRDRWLKRRLVKETTDALNNIEHADLEGIIGIIENAIIDIRDGKPGETPTFGPLVAEAFQEMERLRMHPEEQSGLKFGLLDLDKKLQGGLKRKHLVVLAARPSMGKTSLAMNFLLNQLKENIPGIFFSLEMGADELATKGICMKSQLNYQKWLEGTISENMAHLVVQKVHELQHNNTIFIDDKPKSMLEMRAKCRTMKMKHNIQWVIIDYLQLIPGHGQFGNREQEVAQISRAAKLMAMELDIPVLMLAQLNREVEHRQSPKPRLADLRESGAIEQDANEVLFISPTLQDPEKTRWLPGGKMDILVAKQRSGPIGEVPLTFSTYCALFENYAPNNHDH